MRQPYHREKIAGLRISVYFDDNAESPREWDNIGSFLSWHPRATLGEIQTDRDVESIRDALPKEPAIMLPVYAYEHGGITIRAGGAGPLPYPFNDAWDAGQVGVIFVTLARVREEYKCKRVSAQLRARVADILRAEIETMDQYLTGQVFGYVIESRFGAHVDSCWGFYGLDECTAEAKRSAEWFIEAHPRKYGAGVRARAGIVYGIAKRPSRAA